MLENCKRLICSPSLNKVYCIVLYCIEMNSGSCGQMTPSCKKCPMKRRSAFSRPRNAPED